MIKSIYIKWVISQDYIHGVKIQLELSTYVTKSDLKNATGVNTSDFLKNADSASLKTIVDKLEKVASGLNSLKSKVDKLNIDKFQTVPVDLKKIKRCNKKRLLKGMFMMN